MSAPVLTDDQLIIFRQIHVRDFFDGTTTPPTTYSKYNEAFQKEFFSDSDLLLMDAAIENDLQKKLDALRYEKYVDRLRQGDPDATAQATADQARVEGVYALLLARCRKVMKSDPAYRASLFGGPAGAAVAAEIIKQWDEEIQDAEEFFSSRTGFYTSVRLERE